VLQQQQCWVVTGTVTIVTVTRGVPRQCGVAAAAAAGAPVVMDDLDDGLHAGGAVPLPPIFRAPVPPQTALQVKYRGILSCISVDFVCAFCDVERAYLQ
jgi:hypothetical protein